MQNAVLLPVPIPMSRIFKVIVILAWNHSRDVNLVPRSKVNGPHLGAKMRAVFNSFVIPFCDLSIFISMAATRQHNEKPGLLEPFVLTLPTTFRAIWYSKGASKVSDYQTQHRHSDGFWLFRRPWACNARSKHLLHSALETRMPTSTRPRHGLEDSL